jgi:hypothetical protein
LNLSGKVEGMLSWGGTVDQKQDEVYKKIDEMTTSINQL